MGLESLQSVFGDISSNGVTDSTPIPPTSLTAGQRDSSPNPTLLEDMGIFSIFNEIAENTNRINTISTSQATGLDNIVRIEPITFRQFPSPLSILSEDLPVEYEDGINIRRNELAPNVGVNNNLGVGDFILETLYNKNHTPNTDRIQIPYGQIEINTLRAGMGSLGNLDIKGYSSDKLSNYRGLSTNGIFGGEPYNIINIGSDYFSRGVNRDGFPGRAFVEDEDRLISFYTSAKGRATILKENILSKIGILDNVSYSIFRNPKEYASEVAQKINDSLVVPADARINTGFINFLGRKSRFSLREDYSDRMKSSGLAQGIGTPIKPFGSSTPFKDLGDRVKKIKVGNSTIGGRVSEIGKSIKEKKRKAKVALFGEVNVLKAEQAKAEEKVAEANKNLLETINAVVPEKIIPSTFFDLSKEGNHSDLGRGYDDKIAKSPVEQSLLENLVPLEDETDNIRPGDFYVRIKDTRDNKFIYFRGYVTGITENVSPSFSSTNYIGKSEPVYVYERAERDMSFNLRVYPNNKLEMDRMYEKIEKLTSLAYPLYKGESEGLMRMKAPFTELYMAHIGSRAKGQFGFIKSLSYTVNESGDWDAESMLPRLFDIAISYQILNRKPTDRFTPFYMSDQS